MGRDKESEERTGPDYLKYGSLNMLFTDFMVRSKENIFYLLIYQLIFKLFYFH